MNSVCAQFVEICSQDRKHADPEIGRMIEDFIDRPVTQECSFPITKLGFIVAVIGAAFFIGSEIGKFSLTP